MAHCPNCGTDYSRGDRFDFGVIEQGAEAETSFFECSNCGHLFDDTGRGMRMNQTYQVISRNNCPLAVARRGPAIP